MYSLKDEIEAIFFGEKNPKHEAKRKLNEFYDRFGENRMDIENGTTDAEFYEYIMVSAFADEVLKERRAARLAKAKEQSLLQRDTSQEMHDDIEERKDKKIEDDLNKAEENVKAYEDTGRKAVEAYKNLDKEKIKEDMTRRIYNDIKGGYDAEEKRRKILEERREINVNGIKKKLPATHLSEKADFINKLGNFEGNYDYPYLDSQNIYTVGEGVNIHNDFYSYPWVDRKGNKITDINILKREKEKLDKIYLEQEEIKKKYPKNEWSKHMRKASSFEKESILRLSKSYLDKVKKRKIQEMEAELQKDIDNYNEKYSGNVGRKILDLDVMPEEYAEVLLELKYNLGGRKFNPQAFRKLFRGLILGDKRMILDNLYRTENNANDRKRNDWAQDRLKSVEKLPSIRVKSYISDTIA